MILTPEQLIEKRHDIGFTQSQMAATLGIHTKALQNMEKGRKPIPRYISNYAMCLNILNENILIRKHLKNINVDLKEKE